MGEMGAAAARLREAAPVLRGMDDERVIAGLGSALAAGLGENGWAHRAASGLAERTGASRDMLLEGFVRLIGAHEDAALGQWLQRARDEAGTDGPGPAVVLQILAGNVPGLAIPAAIEALLARSAVLLKSAQDDPVTPAAWRDALVAVDPELGAAVEVATWRGGVDDEPEGAALAEADYVVATGERTTLKDLGKRVKVPHTFHGPRISVGVVGDGWTEWVAGAWDAVAREVALWDQAGCLSPRVLLVTGEVRAFARELAAALARRETEWPAAPRTPAQAAAILQARGEIEVSVHPAGVFSPDGTAWTVVWEETDDLTPGPAARYVRIVPLPYVEPWTECVDRHRDLWQGVGHAQGLGMYAEAARLAGLHTAPLARIQDPPAGWRADGRSGLVELLQAGDAKA